MELSKSGSGSLWKILPFNLISSPVGSYVLPTQMNILLLSLSISQEPTTGPYPEPGESSLHLPVTNQQTNQLTKWSRVLLGKLIVTELDKKFPTFYGTQRFITMSTTACHWSLSSAM
jgi:hypothetical protein